MKTLLVVNPKSGGGKTEKTFPQMRKTIEGALGACDVELTKHAGHGSDIAKKAGDEGYELVVAVGGDGTFNEVANGLMASSKSGTHIGLIGQGTGGDFRKTLAATNASGSDAAIEALVDRLIASTERPIDAGWLTFVGNDGAPRGRAFLNIASFGLGGLVDRLVNDAPKWMGGSAAFFVGALRAAARYRNQAVRVTVDGELSRQTSIANLAVANGRFFGGGMQIAPRAELDDGLFEVVGLENVDFTQQLRLAPHLYAGTLLGKPGVTYTRGKVVVAEPVDAAEHVLLDVDGEAPGRLPARFEIRPGALRLRG